MDHDGISGPGGSAIERDQTDPLAPVRQAFDLPFGVVYLDGNSLGPLPKAVPKAIAQVIERQWGATLIKSWNDHDWINLPSRVGEKIARLIGAGPGQVICTDSVSVNLFKVLAAALGLSARPAKILSEADNFPSDLYLVEGMNALLGEAAPAFEVAQTDALLECLDESVSILLLTQVNFKTGAMHDLAELTARAQAVGALVIWDLSHSTGVLDLEVDAANVDFAVGCGYKFLNGGPGAPGYLYVASRHQRSVMQPLSGWMGHAQPFAFSQGYEPAQGVKRFLSGTPAILSMTALDAALTVFDGLELAQVRAKSEQLGTYLIHLVESIDGELELISPREASQRGSQVSFRHPLAYPIVQALIEADVIGDFRAPDIVRLGFNPLFNSFADIEQAARVLKTVLMTGGYLESRFSARKLVT
ncbi:MAG: kynureninase [Pseudomonadales bacterium]|nr:kynureninase [Pseudomonadales bacterium]